MAFDADLLSIRWRRKTVEERSCTVYLTRVHTTLKLHFRPVRKNPIPTDRQAGPDTDTARLSTSFQEEAFIPFSDRRTSSWTEEHECRSASPATPRTSAD